MGLGVQQINKYEQAQFLFVNDRQKHITNTINKKIQKKLAVVLLFSLFVPLFDSWKVRYVRLFVFVSLSTGVLRVELFDAHSWK